jgi:predicted metal-dependent hydrolase
MAEIQVGDILVEVTYKPVKNLRLTVYPPDGRVKVTAPFSMTVDFIRNFTASKTGWIEKQRAKYQRAAQAGKTDGGPEARFVWGKPYPVEVIERQGHPKITLADGVMRISLRPGSPPAKQQDLEDAFYRRLLREAAPALIETWAGRMALRVENLYIRKMRSHWGSCNHERRTIRLNSELAKRPPECLEYVIVHELTHLIEPSHNRNFYRILDQYLPGWKAIRKGMNGMEGNGS